MAEMTYPVRVTGRLDPDLSRGLWLVKWLLLIPHLVVLALLGVAYWVLTIVAFVAILVTGRYPRAIFGFNLGVLRWGWRVAYYGYGANGTDCYPPFTLADVPDYPARLDVDYPERLSRGRALVQWWLLAIPHYLVLVFFVGSAGTIVGRVNLTGAIGFDGGLVTVLVLIAAVALLFTGRYPRGIFDAVLGMNRWVLRVAAYASLMTDVYPPFRLDQGGDEPAAPVPPADPSSGLPTADAAGVGGAVGAGAAVLDRPRLDAPAPPPLARTVPPPSTGRRVLLTVGALLSAAAVAVTAAGVTGLVANTSGRDPAGFVAAAVRPAATGGYALASDPIRIDIGTDPGVLARIVGQVAVRAGTRSGAGVFVGIGPTADVARYLDGVAVGAWRSRTGDNGRQQVTIVDTPGGPPSGRPADQTFWAATATGPGAQTMIWMPEPGSWTVVVMNADATRPVQTDLTVGAQVPVLGATSGAALGVGLGMLVVGLILITLGARPRRVPADVPTTSGT
jgi:Domain of unknown function (DUF4389)